ncbi:MAG: transglutaminase-like domain-containing protein [bacterium]
MTLPPLFISASLLFWGWYTEFLTVAILIACILEGARFLKFRFELSISDFNRISDLCTLLFIGMSVYFFTLHKSPRIILFIIQWLPVVFLPLIIAQIYSTRDNVPLSVLFLSLRNKKNREGHIVSASVDLSYPYCALCMLSASVMNVKSIWFYVGLLFLSGWALWPQRTKRSSPIMWMCLFILACICGYIVYNGLYNLQNVLEKKGLEWLIEFIRQDTDPFRSKTSIGDIGSLKLSDRILFRVNADSNSRNPLLLREASYNLYKSPNWFALKSDFSSVKPQLDGEVWNLERAPVTDKALSVSLYLKKGKGLLKLPNGTYHLSQLPVGRMGRNQFGVIKVEEGPGLINYHVRYSGYTSLDSPPNKTDLYVPQQEIPVLAEIIQEYRLTAMSPEEIIKSVDLFFRKHFTYSLDLTGKADTLTPLGHFLLQSRSGHCEYFATATVLLLRACGIPARYASGYVVQEFSRFENRFLVRSRHAHAWTLFYNNGRWHDFDTTPSQWIEIEKETASSWESIFDLISWVGFKFSEWRWNERESNYAHYILWVLIPLILFLGRKIYLKKRIERVDTKKQELMRKRIIPGMDSEFYLIEKKLGDLGYIRYQGETLSSWIERIAKERTMALPAAQLHSILALHYRHRFDPKGLNKTERGVLKANVDSWLNEWGTSS